MYAIFVGIALRLNLWGKRICSIVSSRYWEMPSGGSPQYLRCHEFHACLGGMPCTTLLFYIGPALNGAMPHRYNHPAFAKARLMSGQHPYTGYETRADPWNPGTSSGMCHNGHSRHGSKRECDHPHSLTMQPRITTTMPSMHWQPGTTLMRLHSTIRRSDRIRQ